MDEATLKKWRIVKEALEANGKTDTHYYKMAVKILKENQCPTGSGNQ